MLDKLVISGRYGDITLDTSNSGSWTATSFYTESSGKFGIVQQPPSAADYLKILEAVGNFEVSQEEWERIRSDFSKLKKQGKIRITNTEIDYSDDGDDSSLVFKIRVELKGRPQPVKVAGVKIKVEQEL